MASLTLKTNYRCATSRGQFYSGGPFAVASDGSFLACACEESITIVDPSTAAVKSTIEGTESDTVIALALSPDDKLLFSASHSRIIRVWDLASLKCLRFWKGHEGSVTAMACDASGGLLATAGADSKVLVWDVDGGFCTHYFKGHKGIVTTILFHFDPSRFLLFSGSDDTTIKIWDLQSKKCIATLANHFSRVTSLAVSEDGSTLLSAGRDKVVNLWDLHHYRCKLTVPIYEVLEAVCVVRSGTSLASCLASCKTQNQKKRSGSPGISFITFGDRGIVRIWNSEGAVCMFGQQESDVTVISSDDDCRGFTAAVMLPQDQGLLCATADQHFLFYTPSVNSEGDVNLTLNQRLVGSIGPIADLNFLGDKEEFLAVTTNLEQVQVYDLASMSCSYILAGHTDVVLCLDTCVSSSGSVFIVTGSKDNSVRLWEMERKHCIGIGVGHLGDVTAIAFSKKRCDFFVSGSRDGMLKVWSLKDVPVDVEQPTALKAKTSIKAHDKEINSLAVAPNDGLVCSASRDRTAGIWKLPELLSTVVLKGHKRAIYSVEFSPVDQCVLTASADKTIKIWAVSDGSCIKTFEGHTASVLRASFLTRGAQFISTGADGLIKLWTVRDNECIATYDQHEDEVWALAVGKNTEMLASGSNDAVVKLWNDSTASEKLEAFRKEEEGVLRGQDLENAVLEADYTKAIQIAFELRRPHRLYELFSEICRDTKAGNQIERALSVLDKEELHILFEYVREWNTKTKLCHVAQFVLFRIFNLFPPTEIIEVKGISELLEGLVPYSQRHFSRIDRLLRSTFLLDYMLAEMSVIEPETEGNLETNLEPQSDLEDATEEPVTHTTFEERKQTSEEVNYKASAKLQKRKQRKSSGSARKKAKKDRRVA